MSDTTEGGRNLTNALKIIEIVSVRQPIGVSDIARDLQLPKSSVQRTLRTLEHRGWIRCASGERVRWELTERMLLLSLRAAGESLRVFAEPAMTELQRVTNETIHLVAFDDGAGLVLHRLDGDQAVRAIVEIGTRPPLHASSSGHAILAYLPSEELEKALTRPLEACTERTITDPAQLLQRLEKVRVAGYAVNLGEYRNEVASVSCPIRTAEGVAVAAISISLPMSRYTPEKAESYGLLASKVTQALSPFRPTAV